MRRWTPTTEQALPKTLDTYRNGETQTDPLLKSDMVFHGCGGSSFSLDQAEPVPRTPKPFPLGAMQGVSPANRGTPCGGESNISGRRRQRGRAVRAVVDLDLRTRLGRPIEGDHHFQDVLSQLAAAAVRSAGAQADAQRRRGGRASCRRRGPPRRGTGSSALVAVTSDPLRRPCPVNITDVLLGWGQRVTASEMLGRLRHEYDYDRYRVGAQ